LLLALVTAVALAVPPVGRAPAARAEVSGEASITVVSPAGGEVWTAGSTHTIRWRYTGDVNDLGPTVIIELYQAGKSKGRIAASAVPIGANGEGSYTWQIRPSLAVGGGYVKPGSDYQVKVTSVRNRNCWGMSDYFGLGVESITVTSPAGGEVWTAGSTQTIRWLYTGNPGSLVRIELYQGGSSKGLIAASVPIGADGTGSYTWAIRSSLAVGGGYVTPGSGYRIKVTSTANSACWGMSDHFSLASAAQQEPAPPTAEPPPPGETQPPQAGGLILIDDPSFVTLTAYPHPDSEASIAYNLQVKANDPAHPVEVSYLLLNPNGTPQSPSTGMEVHPAGEFESTWSSSAQYFYHTEVGGWAQPQYRTNPQVFGLPHYRTAVMLLARYEKIYLVFLRENDRRLTYRVFKGGPFNGLTVPGLGEVKRVGGQFQIHSYGEPVEVGIWDKGTYRHDEVSGWAQESYAANDKLYDIPQYGMFMLMVARYDQLGLIIGNYNDGRLGAICATGSRSLGIVTVPGLCEISDGGIVAGPGDTGAIPQIMVEATAARPVEVSHFAFDNTCWQWEVGGWAQEEYRANPQILPLNHYTPGFFMCSRYEQAEILFYNENDLEVGILPLSADTLTAGSVALPSSGQPPTAPSLPTVQPAGTPLSEGIRVLLNDQPLAFDQPPVILNGRTLVPLRVIFQALGAAVSWDQATQTITATRDDTVIVLVIGLPVANRNGQPVTLSQPALILNGRTLVPLRFVSEALGAEVNWDQSTQTVTIMH
jgi:hypothetical protein